MAAPRRDVPPVKGKIPHENRFTVMIMRSVGGVRSFKISPRLVFWATLFFLAYIAVSIFAIHSTLNLRRVNALQSDKLKKLEEERGKTRKRLDRSNQHIALLEDYIRNLEEQSERVESPPGPREENPAAKTQEMTPEPARVPQTDNPPTAQAVDIRDLVLQRDGSRMTVDFKLINMDPGENPVGGYVHVVARNRSQPPREWSSPKEDLKGGMPSNYRRGQPFLIQRFKPMKARFELDAAAPPPSSVQVMVYDQSGMLILDKEFEVDSVT